MLKFKLFSVVLFFVMPVLIFGQSPFQQGFEMLEKGEFASAETFFGEMILSNEYKTHKTVRLCYGRAAGLNGKIEVAQSVFVQLLEDYPADFETELNYAESFLWAKNPVKALDKYEALVKRDSLNFAAMLGYANTLSSLKRYNLAADAIEKVLKLDSGNFSAKVSRKYIYMGYADTEIKNNRINSAASIIDRLLKDYPGDADILMLAATLELVREKFSDAVSFYTQLVNMNRFVSQAYSGISYAVFMQKKPAKAMIYADKALESVTCDKERIQAYNGKINALGWNKKFKDAFALIDSMKRRFPQEPAFSLAEARLKVWNQDAPKGVSDYETLKEMMPASLDFHLGYIDALIAEGNTRKAVSQMESSLNLFPEQRDILTMKRKVMLENGLNIKSAFFHSFDNGNNQSDNFRTEVGIPSLGRVKPVIGFQLRSLTDFDQNKSNTMIFSLGGQYRISAISSFRAKVGILAATSAISSFNKPVVEFSYTRKLGKRFSVELFEKTEIQNYNAALLQRVLTTHDFGVNMNLKTLSGMGWYGQGIFTAYSDKNNRKLFFSSLYYDFKEEPCIKTGLNTTFLTFKNSVNESYFSPQRYLSGELFLMSENLSLPKAKLLYHANIAGGVQKIDDFEMQSMYRMNAKIGYRWKDYGYILGYYAYNNALSTNILGYSYNEAGIELKISIPNKVKK